jgi:hypothetical protein
MRARGWSKLKLAKKLGMSENSVRRLLDLRHSSHMWIIDECVEQDECRAAHRLAETPHAPQGGVSRRLKISLGRPSRKQDHQERRTLENTVSTVSSVGDRGPRARTPSAAKQRFILMADG